MVSPHTETHIYFRPKSETQPLGYFVHISVIIPTINESQAISRAVESCWEAGADEIIVADGGSTDATISIAESLRCEVVISSPGRGVQQNRGPQSPPEISSCSSTRIATLHRLALIRSAKIVRVWNIFTEPFARQFQIAIAFIDGLNEEMRNGSNA